MYLTVKMLLFGWRFKGAQILALRINVAFFSCVEFENAEQKGKLVYL
jgi:hypothetical protein